jgi:pimeloyl-ACP methyl ester carboxylesterase
MTISHDVAGEGPAVVLLHSSVCDRRMWEPQWQPLLGAGYRVVRCDFRGFGDTPLADRPYSDAEDVAQPLGDVPGTGPAVLVGSSYGGKVALELAATRPELVGALALLCSGSPGHTPSDALRSIGEQEDALLAAGDTAGAVELMVDTWLGPEADDAARDQLRRMQRHSFEVQSAVGADEFWQPTSGVELSRIEVPCLAVSGRHDVVDFREIAARLPEQLKDARHLELPWAGHLPGLERPEAVSALLIDFLHGLRPAAARG